MTTGNSPTRRSFLGHVAGAYVATVMPLTAATASDPILDIVRAYRAEEARLIDLTGAPGEDETMPVWDVLEHGERLAPARTPSPCRPPRDGRSDRHFQKT